MVSMRADRVAEEMKKEISSIIENQVKDPRIGFVTIISVEISNDLRHAKVFVSALGTDEERTRSMEGLEQAKGFIRRETAQRINLRYAPEIVFKSDKSIEHGVKIAQMLSKLKEGEEERKD